MENIKFKNLDITINSGELVGVIGPNGSGKTILLKMIIGKIKNDFIYIDDKNINEYSLDYKKKNIVCVFNDNFYKSNNVCSELRYYLNLLNIENVDLIEDFKNYFKLDNIIDLELDELNIEDRIFIKILSLLIINPSIVCIDDLLTYLDITKKNKILNYIKENNITLISVTSNMEELLLFDKILVMNKGRKEMFDSKEKVLDNENMFKELGLSLPFIYDINNMLKSYDLIDDKHLIYKELVDILWK